MSLLGYNVHEHFTGRAPLEAAAQGIELGPDDWAIRCNLVSIHDQRMIDFTAGHISNDEARELLDALQQASPQPHLQFVPGVSYRNLLLFRGGEVAAPFSRDTVGTPPHDLADKLVTDDYPRGPGSNLLCDLMQQSVQVFETHPVNRKREAEGKLPATSVWLWGLGKAPRLPSFESQFGIRGSMITAVDLLRGLAALIDWTRIEVPGATGYTDTDYGAKGRFAVKALQNHDLVCVHIEATDEASHEGDTAAKIKALEEISRHIVAPVHAALSDFDDYRLLISPDHPTLLRTKTHSHGYVPWTMCGSGIAPDTADVYDETVAANSVECFDEGHHLMRRFIVAAPTG